MPEMGANKCICLMVVVLLNCACGLDFDKCFKTDSISCLQIEVFETTRNILDTRSITIGGLINITDTKERNGKSLRSLEENFYKAHGIKARQSALENYLETQVKHWWQGAQLTWDSTKMLRTLSSTLSNDLKKDHFFSRKGRAEKIKQKKTGGILLPLLIAIKLKMAAFAAVTYMTIAVIAKKAVTAGAISLLVSGFIAIKHLLETNKNDHTNIHYASWQSPSSSWHNPGLEVHSSALEREADTVIAESNSRPQTAKTDRVYRL